MIWEGSPPPRAPRISIQNLLVLTYIKSLRVRTYVLLFRDTGLHVESAFNITREHLITSDLR